MSVLRGFRQSIPLDTHLGTVTGEIYQLIPHAKASVLYYIWRVGTDMHTSRFKEFQTQLICIWHNLKYRTHFQEPI